MKSEYYSTVQRKKTNAYGEKQYSQLFTTLPIELIRLWDIEKGEIVVWRPNGNDEFIVKKIKNKPQHNRLTYEEWLAIVKPHIPIGPPGKTYEEISKEAGILGKAASAIWVNRAKNDIGLNNKGKEGRHRTLWFRTTQISTPPNGEGAQDGKERKRKESNFGNHTLGEFS
jgi:hypothetical protein